MAAELAMSSPLVELSDINVTTDISCQGPLTEHVVNQEDGLEIKQTAKVGQRNQSVNCELFSNTVELSPFKTQI